MACSNEYQQILETVPSYFEKEISQRMFPTDAWLPLVERENWPLGVGQTISYIITEPTFAADEDTWTTVSQGDDSTPNSSCGLPGDTVPTAQTVRNASLDQKALNSDDICFKKTILAWEFRQQLTNTLRNFEKAVARVWARYTQANYAKVAGNKIIAASSLPRTGSLAAWNTTAPTTRLVQGILDVIYDELIQNGAGVTGAYAMNDGQPTFLLMSDRLTLDGIIRDNPEVRQDYRWAEASELLKPLGVRRSYRGFFHYTLQNQRRFNLVNHNWVEIPQYTTEATTNGSRRVLNPDYIAAEYGESYVFHKEVLKLLPVIAPSALGGNVQMNPQNYMGDVQFKQYGITECNRDGDTGFFRANLMVSSKPIFPEFGYAIRHKLCPAELGFIDCAASS